MKPIKNQEYESPVVRLVKARVEKGFATSQPQPDKPEPSWPGENDAGGTGQFMPWG